jgi:hypothetical protein
LGQVSGKVKVSDMADPSNRGGDSPTSGSEPLVNDRVQELTWALVDEQITDDEMQLLENLMLSDDAARDTYIGCVQLHTDLLAHYAGETSQPFLGGKVPILGFLGEGSTSVDNLPAQQ